MFVYVGPEYLGILGGLALSVGTSAVPKVSLVGALREDLSELLLSESTHILNLLDPDLSVNWSEVLSLFLNELELVDPESLTLTILLVEELQLLEPVRAITSKTL